MKLCLECGGAVYECDREDDESDELYRGRILDTIQRRAL